jgi:ABC-type nitrate/sulfonate/bicarbonate transport system ATPase subunit/ABC-type nitrate/sulfonate/bicarbonate transport system permease component
MMSKFSPAWLSVAALLLLWQFVAIRVNHPALFPSVTQLAGTIIDVASTASFYQSFMMTLARAVAAFLLATLMALPASVLAFHFRFWKTFFHPLIVIMRSIPVIAIVLIALLYLSPTRLPLIIGCITMLPILYQNFLSAWELTDPKLTEMARVYQKTILQRFRYVYFLQSKDLLFAGIATATGFGWRAIIIGEVLSGPVSGIGSAMKKSQAYIDMPGLLTWTLIAIGGGFLIEWVWKKLAKIGFQPVLKTFDQAGSLKAKQKPTQPSIQLEAVSFSYTGQKILNNFNFQLSADRVYLLNGSSGSGKTTLLKILAGILHPQTGTVQRSAIRQIAFSFQDQRLIPMLTIEQNIAFSLPDFPTLTAGEQQRLDYLLHKTGMAEHRDKFPGELSGGEQQRVNLIRALLLQADLLLLDEPLTGLDSALKEEVLQLLNEEFSRHTMLVVWATHENTSKINVPTLVINEA